jgi:transposase
MARSTSLDFRYVQRAKVILLWLDGASLDESHTRLDMSRTAVNQWRRRFEAQRLAGLKDAPRPGRPALISATVRARVIETARSKPVDGSTTLSQRRIARACGVSQTTVHQILREADLKPHKIEYWCGKPTDPEFEAKMVDIIGLYLNPPENALVLCVDEKTGIQALDRTQPELPLRQGAPRRLTATYKRHGTVSLIAALSVHSGEVSAQTMDRNDADNFLAFLRRLYRQHPHQHLHVIVDNLSVHKDKKIAAWLGSRRRITLHFTPTYASWLNQIEIWFGILTREVLKGGVWTSKAQLVKQLMQYVRAYTRDRAKPFCWTYTGKPCTE